MSSKANEGKTDQSIEELGLNLANEVKEYINTHMRRYGDSGLKLKRLTFVGHSLGGIIVR